MPVIRLVLVLSLLGVGSAGAGEPATAPEYRGYFGAFGDTPFLILAHTPGAKVNVRADFGLRQWTLEPETARAHLATMQPYPVETVAGVTVYTAPGRQPFTLSYPVSSLPVLWIADPDDTFGTGGGDVGRGRMGKG